MKHCKCNKCGNVQNFELLNCQKCGEEMSKVEHKGAEMSKKIVKQAARKPWKAEGKFFTVMAYLAFIFGVLGLSGFIVGKGWQDFSSNNASNLGLIIGFGFYLLLIYWGYSHIPKEK